MPRVGRVPLNPKLSTLTSTCNVRPDDEVQVDCFDDRETVPGVAHPGATGVIYCTDRAMANGFSYGNEGWVRVMP